MQKVNAEMDLMMLSYNFKRVLNILGVDALRTFCLQRAEKGKQDAFIAPHNPSLGNFFSRLSHIMDLFTQIHHQVVYVNHILFSSALS